MNRYILIIGAALFAALMIAACAEKEVTIREYHATGMPQTSGASTNIHGASLTLRYVDRYAVRRTSADGEDDIYRRAPVLAAFIVFVDNTSSDDIVIPAEDARLTSSRGETNAAYTQDSFKDTYPASIYNRSPYLYLFTGGAPAEQIAGSMGRDDYHFPDEQYIPAGKKRFSFLVFEQISSIADSARVRIPIAFLASGSAGTSNAVTNREATIDFELRQAAIRTRLR